MSSLIPNLNNVLIYNLGQACFVCEKETAQGDLRHADRSPSCSRCPNLSAGTRKVDAPTLSVGGMETSRRSRMTMSTMEDGNDSENSLPSANQSQEKNTRRNQCVMAWEQSNKIETKLVGHSIPRMLTTLSGEPHHCDITHILIFSPSHSHC